MPVVLTGYWQVFNYYTTKTATDVTSWLGYKMARPSKFINGILSRANINTVFFHYNLKKLFEGNQIRCRVALKGNTILDIKDGRPLDGNCFGFKEGRLTFLRFPSGDVIRGGDFESWFYLVE